MIRKWKVISAKRAYHSRYMDLYADKVWIPKKNVFTEFMRVKKPDFVMIVATDTKNRVIALKEYRHAVGEIQLLIPAGFINKRESPLKAAKRELAEETGYTGGKFSYICSFTSEYSKGYVFRAIGLKDKGEQRLDDNEDIETSTITITELKRQIAAGKWRNGSTLAALTLSGILS
jgi:8-oxo-dGTP pyrophosphatase MutT (NUDIX family)